MAGLFWGCDNENGSSSSTGWGWTGATRLLVGLGWLLCGCEGEGPPKMLNGSSSTTGAGGAGAVTLDLPSKIYFFKLIWFLWIEKESKKICGIENSDNFKFNLI